MFNVQDAGMTLSITGQLTGPPIGTMFISGMAQSTLSTAQTEAVCSGVLQVE